MKKLVLTALVSLFVFAAQAQDIKIYEPSLTFDAKAQHGESPIWDVKNQKLYWTDMGRHNFNIYDPATKKNETVRLPGIPGTIILTEKGDKVVLPIQDAVYTYTFATKELTEVAKNPNTTGDGKVNRFNDGDCDPAGRLWVGTENKDGSGKLYRIDGDYSVHQMLDEVYVSNGICFSADKKTMYYIDSQLQRVDAFDYNNKTGEISGRRTVIEFPKEMGMPDGSTIDRNGTIWICAISGGAAVTGWDPKTGKQVAKVDVPARNVTACAFGGKDLNILYITTAGENNPDGIRRYPYSGGIFEVDLGVKGYAPYLFKEKK